MTDARNDTTETGTLSAAEASLLERVDALWSTQLQWTRDLIAIPTVNPYSGDDSAAIETPGQAWIADRFKELGASVEHVPVPEDIYEQGGVIGPAGRTWKDRQNVVARWEFGRGGTSVLLNDHMDTVGTSTMTIDPYDPVVKGDQIFGRGTSDTKGNMMVGLAAVAAILQDTSGLRGRIVFESVVDEECDGAGAGTLACCLAGVTGDIAICLDGATGAIHNGCNGIVTGHLKVRGRGGHSSTGGSINAIDKGFVAKAGVDRFGEAYQAKHPQCFTNVGVFRAGSKAGSVPSLAELMFNMSYDVSDAEEAHRSTGNWGGAAVRKQIEQAMADLGKEDAWFKESPIETGWIKDMYPFRSDVSGELAQRVVRSVADVKGQPVPVRSMPAWFDGAHLSRRLQVPVLGVGSGTAGTAHSGDESARLSDLRDGARSVALALHRLLSGA